MRSLRPSTRPERGQVLVVFAGGLITLLAIAALVFDLGMDFMLHRQEQNAADPAALAAAKYIPSVSLPLAGGNNATSQMTSAACYYAQADGLFPGGFSTSGATCTATGDPNTSLTVYYPPSGTSAGEFAGRPGFVQAVVTKRRQNFFLGIFGQPTSVVATSAVAANTLGDSNSYSLLALDPGNDCGAGKIGGNGGGSSSAKVTITPAADVSAGTGGYVQVNATCASVPNPPVTTPCLSSGTGALQVSGGSSITAPSISTSGTCANSGTITTSSGSSVTQGALQVGDPLSELVPPDPLSQPNGQCGAGGTVTNATQAQGCSFNGGTTYYLAPGTYYGGWSIGNNVTLELSSGIYVIAGGGIKLNAGGSITSVTSPGGAPAPVLIYGTDDPAYKSQCLASWGTMPQNECQRSIDLEAQSTLDITGLDSGPYKGLVVWQDGNASCANPSAACSVTVGGQNTMSISGTIYAPKTQVTLVGGGAVVGTASVQIISWQWTIGGGSNLTMPYDPNLLYHLEQRGLVH